MSEDAAKAITDYWFAHYVHPTTALCVLCGNTGQIDTRQTARSPAGVATGAQSYCICPNGQAMRLAAGKREKVK